MSSPQSMNDLLLKLQESLCHQGEDIARLSDEVFAQQKEIKALKGELMALKQDLSVSKDQPHSHGTVTEEQRPPHY